MTGRKILLTLLIAATISAPAYGQYIRSSNGDPYVLQAWTVEDGLPQNSVNAIEQSGDGFLWIATYGGLARFDGVSFRTYLTEGSEGNVPQRIRRLALGSDSTLWVGTESGNIFTLKKERLQKLRPEGVPTHGDVIDLRRSPEGLVWVGSEGSGLYRGARLSDGRDTLLPSTLTPDFPRSDISAIAFSPTGSLWIGGYGGVARLFGAGIQTFKLPTLGNDVRVDVIDFDSLGNVWIGTTELRVYRLHDAKVPYLEESRFNRPYAFDEVVSPDRPDLRVALHIGMLRFDNGRFVQADASLQRGWQVRSVHIDPEGNIWFGTVQRGLMRIRRATFEVIKTRSEASVTSMAEDRNGDIFIGQNCGPIEVIRGRQIVPHPLTDFAKEGCVWSLFIDDHSRLWIGSWGGGAVRLDPSSPAATATTFARSSFIGSDVVLAITQARDGAMWFGTHDAGIVRSLRDKHRRWTTKEGLPDNDVRCIAIDSAGSTWVGTSEGLARIVEGIVQRPTPENGFPTAPIRTLHVDPDGCVWVGTYGDGLYRWRNGSFRRLGVDQGLFDNIVSQFLEGAQGSVWMGSNKGIWKVLKQELHAVADGILPRVTSISYGRSDGLVEIETNGGFQPSGLQKRNEDLLFPTIRGVALVQTSKMSVNKTPPPVVIERIDVDGESMDIDNGLRIPSGTHEVNIGFTALSFTSPEKMKFRYRLLGYNANWVDLVNRRSASFTNLSPGSYVFRVIAANNDGVWNEEGADIAFTIETPFYMTMWFRALAVLALVGMGMLVASVRLRQVRQQKAMQEDTSRRLIQSQELERQRIAGELHDSLGQELIVAKNRVMIAVHHMPDDAPARQELTQVADALSVALKSVRNIAYNLRPFQLDRLGLSETIRSTVRTIQQATSIVIETEIENIDGLLEKDSEIGLFRIVQEALTNVVKHSEATRASIVVSRDEEAVVVRVQDNGKGFSVSEETKPSQTFGFGLSGIGERVRLLKGIYKIASTPGSGTTLAVRVPTAHHGVFGL